MFVAWRDLRFARGRFALIASVVALITLLVGFLAGLAGGLASQNISAVLALPGDKIVLSLPAQGQASYSDSSISAGAVATWRRTAGVTAVLPVGITQGRAVSDGPPVTAALFGMPGSAGKTSMARLAPAHDDEIGLSAGAVDQLDVRDGDRVSIAGSSYVVTSVGDDLSYNHTPVIVMSASAWSKTDRSLGGTGQATALAVDGSPDWDAAAAATHTTATTHVGSLTALATFKSEIGSLGLMIAMLFGVSALVVGAFFTVWTMQRRSDIAVLKALGATTRSLVRDALGQAAIVLTAGIGAGLLIVVGLTGLAPPSLPLLLSPLTTLLPAAVMALLGLAGAGFALRSVTQADPLTALGSNR